MIRPEQMQRPDPIDLKLGIKSSLPNAKKALALLILLWESNGQPASLIYGVEDDGKLLPEPEAFEKLHQYLDLQLTLNSLTEDDLYNAYTNNPLLKSQIEALIVAFELVWRLTKVTFVNKMAFSAERTGGKRFAKELQFTRNMDIIDTTIFRYPEEGIPVLLNWLTGNPNIVCNPLCESALIKMLTHLSEEAIYKMSSGSFDITFQNNGIYQQLSKGHAEVDVSGEEEAKGSLRILKAALGEKLNYYLDYKANSTKRNPTVAPEVLDAYSKRVSTYLSLSNFNVVFSEAPPVAPTAESFVRQIEHPHNRIVFGAPGTGKSHTIEQDRAVFGDAYERVTFHPNYSYAQFVGTYKPVPSVNSRGDDIITYTYVPGPFMRVLVKAMQAKRDGSNTPQLLIIEEINRSNVAAVFGDVFQLLDRKNGVSEYPIETSEDIRKYLAGHFNEPEENFKQLIIPDNMYMWATMNSADQGVFPMDTAFRRRWHFEYLGINHNSDKIVGRFVELNAGHSVEWNTLREAINKRLSGLRVNEDKLIGPFFLGLSALTDKAAFNSAFKSKVLMYLYEDAARQHRSELFRGCDYSTYSAVCDAYDEKGEAIFGLPSLAQNGGQ